MANAVGDMKKCPRCPAPKPLSAFTRNRTQPDGLNGMCRDCSKKHLDHQREKRRVAAGRPPPKVDTQSFNNNGHTPQNLTAAEGLERARLKGEIKRLQQYAKELEERALGADGVRSLFGTLRAPNVTQQPDWLKGAAKPKSTTGTGVLFLSDIHFDEVVRPEEIGGCNAYNREIATQRLRNTFRNTVSLLRGHLSRASYDGMVCALGGDLVSGNIHDELVETNEFTIGETMLALEAILIEGLGGLADEFGKLHVPCVTGNHGRMHKKPRAKGRAHHNFEWMIYQRLAAYFKTDSRITFDIPEGSDAYFTIYKLRHMLTHGDQFRGGGGIGGILIPILRGLAKKLTRQNAMGQPFDVAMMGHWHSYIHMLRLIINGSVKGYDEYASQSNFEYEPPQQACWIEHPEAGMTFRMPVLCDKAS